MGKRGKAVNLRIKIKNKIYKEFLKLAENKKKNSEGK